MNDALTRLHKTVPALFSGDLDERFHATKNRPAQVFERLPRGCWGSANGWLMLLGPSPGRADPDEISATGGVNRPNDSNASIALEPGRINFTSNPSRSDRWNLLTSTIVGSEKKASALTTVANLDWGHQANSAELEASYLRQGCPIIWDFIQKTRPRVIVVLVWRTWKTFTSFLGENKFGVLEPVFEDLHPVPWKIQIPGCDFSSLVVKAGQHPSRHFFKRQHAEDAQKVIQRWLKQQI